MWTQVYYWPFVVLSYIKSLYALCHNVFAAVYFFQYISLCNNTISHLWLISLKHIWGTWLAQSSSWKQDSTVTLNSKMYRILIPFHYQSSWIVLDITWHVRRRADFYDRLFLWFWIEHRVCCSRCCTIYEFGVNNLFCEKCTFPCQIIILICLS